MPDSRDNAATPTQARTPTQAHVVVVGGGIMGCALAYHLAHEGWSDVVLLEKAELTSGSTWHAAGQITRSTSSLTLGRCVDYNIGLYAGALERETGQSVTWHGCGSFRLAYTEDEMDWLRHTLGVARALDVDIALVDPEFVRARHPFYDLDGVRGALYTPDDGHVDPSGVTQALASGARRLGVRVVRRCRATDIRRAPGGEWTVAFERTRAGGADGVETGEIVCEHVVNAAGTYARQIGDWSGLTLPMTSMTHHYFVTEPVPELAALDTELPVIRDDRHVSGYVRMEQQGILIGVYEKESPNTVWEDHCPWGAENELFAPDYDRVMPWLAAAFERLPILAERGIRRDVHGAISHPPDGNPLIGPAPGAPNYWCCCGTQIGIGWGPGLARELARWIVHGSADLPMREFDPRRFGPWATKDWQIVKAKEDYCLRHEIPFPHLNRLAGRPVKPSPLHERLRERGAVFEEVYGHERPRWFARDGVAQHDHYSFRRNVVHDIVAAEVRAVRERAGLMDISAFAKVEVAGPDAAAFVGRLVANRVPARVGGIALTHFLNRRGRIELEASCVRLAEDRLYLVCAAFFERRLLDHLAAHRRADERVEIVNRSDAWAALALNGPRAREILGACTDAALDDARFPWLRARTIDVAGLSCHALRLSYAGELGWELHAPRERLPDLYDALVAAGDTHGLADYGSFAMNAMRLEKMFKGAGELGNDVTLPEAGVMRFVDTGKDFVGREATLASLAAPLPWTCVYLEIEPDGVVDGHGGEAVLLDGETVGATSSVAFGHTVGKILAFAYVESRAATPGQALDVLIAGEPRRARVLSKPAYDPGNARPRAAA